MTRATTSSATGPTTPQYAPRDWWGEDLDDGSDDVPATWGDHHDPQPGTNREEWIAYKILKDSAPALLCPFTLHGTPALPGGRTAQLLAWLLEDEYLEHNPGALHTANGEVELSDPELYVPTSLVETDDGPRPMYGAIRASRCNPEWGYITGPHIKDRSTEEFLEAVDVVLARARETSGLWSRQADRVRTYARALKSGSHHGAGDDNSDVAIMAEVIRAIEDTTGEYLDERGF